MKNNKTNKKPRKVKNYLSSLCKWAKNNILNIFCALMSALLLLGIFSTSCNNSKTAYAQADISNSNSSFIVLPSVDYVYNNTTYYVAPMFLSGNSTGILLSYQNSGIKVSYNQVAFLTDNVNPSISPSLYLTSTSARPHFFSSEVTSSYEFFNLGSYPNDRFAISDKRLVSSATLNYDLINYLYNYCNEVSYYIYNTDNVNGFSLSSELGVIRFDFSCLDLSAQPTPYVACSLYVIGLFKTSNPYSLVGQDFVCLSQTVDLDSYVESLLQQYYQNGYNDGFNIGYSNGYDIGLGEGYIDGYNEGLDVGSGLNHPFSFITNGIDELFSIQVFGDITLGDILRIGFACVLLGFLIKIFLGG